MDTEFLVRKLKLVGWKAFAPGQFLDVDFDQIGKATVSRNDWFVLLQSIQVLDADALENWTRVYQAFSKKARGGFFTAGKYFVLILLVDKIDEQVLEQFSWVGPPGFLTMPDDIPRGGGLTLMLVKNRHEIFKPKPIELAKKLRATGFIKKTYKALEDYKNSQPVFEFYLD